MRSCENCGSALSRAYARVLGDNNDGVSACVHCVRLERQR
ncbi:DUF7563 family protein [Natronorubrum bangense]